MPVRPTAPLPYSLPGLQVSSLGTATATIPFGLSSDRKTVYGGTPNGTNLYESTNDGTTWTLVRNFTDRIASLVETDDGEAVAFGSNAASTPGYIWKSSGWSTSHTGATWTKVLTTHAGYIQGRWGGHSFSFGNDKILAGTSKVGVTNEYGPQTTTGTLTTSATQVFYTEDYGASWRTILDLAVRYPGVQVLHTHNSAYDPYWDRIWVLYGDSLVSPEGSTKSLILYSDDRGITWNALDRPAEWNTSTSISFLSTTISVLPDCIILGSDSSLGHVRLARQGYRKVGPFQVMGMMAPRTNSDMISQGVWQNRNAGTAPLLLTNQAQIAETDGAIYCTRDGGRTLTRLWYDVTKRGVITQVWSAVGPTYNGKILAHYDDATQANLVVGTLVIPEPGLFDAQKVIVGDGTTTVFNFAHGLGFAPPRFTAWNERPVTGTYAVTADATNVIVTFATAPTNALQIPFQYRWGV